MDPEKITYFGETDSRGKRVRFGIKAKDRTRHVYVIGKTGMGKSTLLENMAIQDIQNGEGMAFLDPHGKTAELLLNYVPPERLNDIVYFAPFDIENPISFNVLEDIGVDKRHLVVAGLMSTFKKIWVDAWSARMEYILTNTLLALIEYPGSTLLGVNRMLSDKDYRKKVVDNVKDVSVKSFWIDEFAKYTEKMAAEAVPAIQNKIGQFTANPLIRNIVGQPKSFFSIREIMDNKKILIINLSKGRVGEANANLLGSMMITKIYLAAMSRADVSEKNLKNLPNFYLFVDEFQSFANESFADILSEARKYKLNLTIAHQYIEQMSEEVRSAVFGNVGTMIVFRVGAFDAEVLEKEFAPQFTAEDLVNLGMFQMYLKLMIDGVGSVPFSSSSLPPFPEPIISYKSEVISYSRKNFSKKKEEVEEEIKKWHEEGKFLSKINLIKSIQNKYTDEHGSGIRINTDKHGLGTQINTDTKYTDGRGLNTRIDAGNKYADKHGLGTQINTDNIKDTDRYGLGTRMNTDNKIDNEKPKFKKDYPSMEAEGDDFISLKEFAKKIEKEPKKEEILVDNKIKNENTIKEMSAENLTDLRNALNSVVKKIEKSENEFKKEEKQKEKTEVKLEEKTEELQQTKEISEEDLKKVLGI